MDSRGWDDTFLDQMRLKHDEHADDAKSVPDRPSRHAQETRLEDRRLRRTRTSRLVLPRQVSSGLFFHFRSRRRGISNFVGRPSRCDAISRLTMPIPSSW